MPTKSEATVWRLTTDDPPSVRYVKLAGPADDDELAHEADVLRRLAGRLPVPAVVDQGVDDGRIWLLTEACPGLPATAAEHRFGSVEPLVAAFASGLRAVHDLPTAGLDPVPLDRLLAAAERRVAAGLVDRSDFEPLHQRYTPAALFDHLVAMRPADADEPPAVLVHGDFTLDNVLLGPGADQVSGIVDWGRAGVGDPYRDLAVAARSLAHELGAELGHRFFDAYGLDHPDLARLDFYVLLDEFS